MDTVDKHPAAPLDAHEHELYQAIATCRDHAAVIYQSRLKFVDTITRSHLSCILEEELPQQSDRHAIGHLNDEVRPNTA